MRFVEFDDPTSGEPVLVNVDQILALYTARIPANQQAARLAVAAAPGGPTPMPINGMGKVCTGILLPGGNIVVNGKLGDVRRRIEALDG